MSAGRDPVEDLKAVERFSRIMLQKLAQHRDKRHWSHYDTDHLFGRLEEELSELAESIEDYFEAAGSPESTELDLKKAVNAVLWECGDVANFSMMIADNLTREAP